jgi:hypothetical protein
MTEVNQQKKQSTEMNSVSQDKIAKAGIEVLVSLLDSGYHNYIGPKRRLFDMELICPSSVPAFQIQVEEGFDGPARVVGECINKRCAYYRSYCSLGATVARVGEFSIAQGLNIRPSCSLRTQCRWYQENGLSACQLCPDIVRVNRNK